MLYARCAVAVLMIALSGCCLSPYFKGCGMDDSSRMRNQAPWFETRPDIDAMAVPSVFDKDELFTKERLKAYRQLVAFIQKERPGCEIVFYMEPKYDGYERLPIRFNGFWIFVGRKAA